MSFFVTTLKQAAEHCDPFKQLRLPADIRDVLNSGIVAFYLSDSAVWYCWPHFPIGRHRLIVKDLVSKGYTVPPEVRIIIEVKTGKGVDVRKYILDCMGHVILFLLDPKASNECDDAMRLVKKLNIELL